MASYLDTPRIHFAGDFRADPPTANNKPCNFAVDENYDIGYGLGWNGFGTGEFAFLDTKVYGAVSKDGKFIKDDPVIGARVLDNYRKPFAKYADLDVDAQLITSTIYGMRFGIGWEQINEDSQNLAFKGEWTSNAITQSYWLKVKGLDDLNDNAGVSSTTTITNIIWNESYKKSPILTELKESSGNKLQVSISLYSYRHIGDPRPPNNFSLGHVVGTIGISKEGEPLNYGGDRLLIPVDEPKLKDNISWPWVFNAPFKLHTDSSVLTVDLSNSLPVDIHSEMLDIGELLFAILDESAGCVELISYDPFVPYLTDNWIKKTGGVVDYRLFGNELNILKSTTTLVLVQKMTAETDGSYIACGQKMMQNDDEFKYLVLLRESKHYIRPMGFYRARLEYLESVDIPLFVTHLGNPAKYVNVFVKRSGLIVQPENGVTVDNSGIYAMKKTDSSGLATFTYNVAKQMSTTRYYTKSLCNASVLPIDGQVYHFAYGICNDDKLNVCAENEDLIVIRAFSSNTYSNPTWDDDVYPIFHQYYFLYPVMSGILNLTDYESVTKNYNLELLKHSMSLDINDPNYMPVTRDLPPSQQKMILEWLENPIKSKISVHSKSSQMKFVPICALPETTTAQSEFNSRSYLSVCMRDKIAFNTNTVCDDMDDINYYRATLKRSDTDPKCTRPLYGYSRESDNPNFSKLCTLKNLQDQLQIAVQIEFATIPLYLTSLYSIVDRCNVEIYEILRGVAMQEMLHLIQVANILIATGRDPIIDSFNFVPKYPSKGLPGCVHPNLKVNLDKFNLKHVHDVFVTIEQPNITCIAQPFPELVNNTIGQFYHEIEDCIETLGDDIFQEEESQVNWPWDLKDNNTLGKVHIIKDVSTALAGIKEIIEQGEGSGPLDPDDALTGQLAHYYRFQEIVCGRKLKKVDDKHYAYKGDRISFDPRGIWPMRPHPSKKGITKGTNCYTAAKSFHEIFRALLRELQTTFSGNPSGIINTVELMESLLVHIKRTMRVKFDDDDDVNDETCGPVWDYHWDD